MSYTAPPTFVTGAPLTAPQMNVISGDVIDLDRRTTPAGDVVVANETCTSGSYVALATTGPAVAVIIGANGKCLISLYAAIQGSVAGNECFMGFAVSGATSVAEFDGTAISFTPGNAGNAAHVGSTHLITGLNAGSTTFTARYKRNTSGTANFSDRRLAVTPLGA